MVEDYILDQTMIIKNQNIRIKTIILAITLKANGYHLRSLVNKLFIIKITKITKITIMKKTKLYLFLIFYSLNLSSQNICGVDGLYNPICFEESEPDAYEKSKAVVLLKLGSVLDPESNEVRPINIATGWIVGDEGHILTAYHTYNNQFITDPNTGEMTHFTPDYLASVTQAEFMAEGAECSTNCKSFNSCPGETIATSMTIIDFDIDLDYILLKMTDDALENLESFDFLTINNTGANVGEQVYMPQHPGGWGKHISFESTHEGDEDGTIHIQSIDNNNTYAKFYADAAFGSSGSPVISYENQCVVAMLLQNGCPKISLNMWQLAPRIQQFLPASAFSCGACGTGSSITITGTEEYMEDMEMSGNLIIENGAQLTVKSTLSFGKNKSLTVKPGGKLILDGGKLTKCPSAENWKGVEAKSTLSMFYPNIPSEVIMKNNSTIEYAKIGINTENITNPTIQIFAVSYGGAIIDMDQSTISYCNQGIKLSRYGNNFSSFLVIQEEKGKISNSIISHCDEGVYADGNIGFEIETSRFLDNIIDLRSYASAHVLKTNEFNNGVEILSNGPNLFGSKIEGNHFNKEFLIIKSQGNFEITNIENNIFVQGSGVWMEGDINFLTTNNDFIDSYYGNFSWFTGENQAENVISNNYFQNNLYSNSAHGTNDVEYLINCFENSEEADVEVGNDSSIRIVQGSEVSSTSAGNCFENSTKIITGHSTEEFTYLTNEGFENENSCKYPGDDEEYNFNTVYCTEEIDPNNCGSSLDLPEITQTSINNCDCDLDKKSDCLNKLADLKYEIFLLNNDTSLEYFEKRLELAKLKRCIDRIMKNFIMHLIEQKDMTLLVETLSNEENIRYKSMAYSYLVNSYDYENARYFLDNYSPLMQEEIDFVNTQHIHLDYLLDIKNYELPNDDKTTLISIGKRKTPTSGYARSLIYKLTGEVVEIEYDHVNGRSMNRNEKVEAADLISIYPNPISDKYFTINFKKYNPRSNYKILVKNTVGEEILDQKITEQNTRFDIFDVKGILFISIIKNGKIVSVEKIVRL